MKILKILTLVLAIPIFMGISGIVNAETPTAIIKTESVKDLNNQLVSEIKLKLTTPLLNFRSKDLKGDVKVTVKVAENGKLVFSNVRGVNKNAISNIEKQLNELNLWTSRDSKGVTFDYTVKYRN
ncbi:MAG TPA: hypothetical protein DEP28_07720 [Bacteroidetes bacterium]|nr:hypothetical protein [Bacteroidota bacterium]